MRKFVKVIIVHLSGMSGCKMMLIPPGLKKLNEWPTFPQLIVNGELVGGLDIVQEMIDNGEFAEVIA